MADAISLRDVEDSDLPLFFRFQLDEEANRMAAFTSRDPSDRNAFAAPWAKIRNDPTVTMRTILFEGRVAGSVGSYVRDGRLEVTYWIGREFWGKGIATRALRGFLTLVRTRPICASAASDNFASIRVLGKCGFRPTGSARAFADARGREIEEVFLQPD